MRRRYCPIYTFRSGILHCCSFSSVLATQKRSVRNSSHNGNISSYSDRLFSMVCLQNVSKCSKINIFFELVMFFFACKQYSRDQNTV